MAKYPIFLELDGRRVVIIGGGAVATRKAEALLSAGARLVVVAEQFDDVLVELCQKSNAQLIKSSYFKNYLAGSTLAIAATNNPAINEQIYEDCQELKILCNVVDDPELCDFFVPAVARRGDLQIAIGTEGHCPAYASYLRKKLEQTFTEKHGQFLTELEKIREDIIEDVFESTDRKTILEQLASGESFEYFIENGPELWRQWAEKIAKSYQTPAHEM
jgi:precorrin-2 dehydrogenase/sirohydrochlorin ferrochelatase